MLTLIPSAQQSQPTSYYGTTVTLYVLDSSFPVHVGLIYPPGRLKLSIKELFPIFTSPAITPPQVLLWIVLPVWVEFPCDFMMTLF